MEDIRPIEEANRFRTQFLPHLQYYVYTFANNDESCLPKVYPMLHSIHCQMTICILKHTQALSTSTAAPLAPFLSNVISKMIGFIRQPISMAFYAWLSQYYDFCSEGKQYE